MEERPHLACCQFADAEMLATDPDVFDCQTCQVADAIDGLWPENRQAWDVFHQLFARFVVEAHLIGQRWDALTEELDAESRNDLFERLGVIYDMVQPKRVTRD